MSALTNLLDANVNAGLTYFVSAGGYHRDAETRAIFLKVCY